jgi:tRNA uridine 5-carboxymethylaminomethyl modification enzyme
VHELAAEALYAPYLARQAESLRMLQAEERVALPAGLDFSAVPGLSLEMRQRLEAAKPSNLGAASRVPGITPAALAALTVHLR